MNKLIKTEAEHADALERLSVLMDADPAEGTKEADELELLAHLIEQYEQKAFPRSLPDPIEAIQFRMEQAGLKRKDLAPLLGGASRVSEVLSGKRALSPAMMRRLHADLGIPAEVLLQEPKASLPQEFPVRLVKPAVLKHMCERGWFGRITSTRAIKDHLEEALSQFFGPDINLGAVPAHYRKGAHGNYVCDTVALLAWKIRVKQCADREINLPSFSPELINADFLKLLTGLSTREDGPVQAIQALRERGIGFVYEPHLPGTRLDGAALHNSRGNPIIALTARHDRLDNFWFCLLHELGHVKLHLGEQEEILDDDLDDESTSRIEKQADQFALEATITKSRWPALKARCRTPVQLQQVAREQMLHPAILAGRIRKEAHNYRRFTKQIGHGQVRMQLNAMEGF